MWRADNELANRLTRLLTHRRYGAMPYWLDMGLAWFVEQEVQGDLYSFPGRDDFVSILRDFEEDYQSIRTLLEWVDEDGSPCNIAGRTQVAVELTQRSCGNVCAIAEDHHPIGDLEYFVEPVADIDDADATLLQVLDDREELFDLLGSQGRAGLVHHQDAGAE